MDHLIICNTPYQVFNAINILANDVGMDHSYCDILIDETFHSFNNCKKIGPEMIKHKVCRNVFYATQKIIDKRKSKVSSFVYLLNKNHLNEFEFSDDAVLNIKYDSIWVGDGNTIGWSLYRENRKAEMVWYDDGLLSYAASPRNCDNSSLYEIIMKLFHLGSYQYHPGRLYVNNSSLAVTKDFSVRQLPVFDDNNVSRSIIEDIFDYREDKSFLRNYRFFALIDGQTLPGIKGYNGTDMEDIIDQTCLSNTEVVIRKHPRDTRAYKKYSVDKGANLWELECIKHISNKHVLLSCCSTAQLTPKLICQKEPYLIFLYKFFLQDDSPLVKLNNDVINQIQNMYSDKSKVFVPNNTDELNSYLLRIQDYPY